MNYDDIFLFVKLINIGTFTELAKLTNVSQSTVSRRIQNLEESLNTRLITRNSRGLIEMTAEGKILYESFNDLESQANNALQKLLNSSKEVQGILKIAMPKLFFDNIIADKLDIFYTRYPNVKLVFSYTVGINDLAKEGIDVAITTKKPTAHNCTVKTLVKAKNKLYASDKYIKENGMPKNIIDLQNHNVVGFLNNDELQSTLVAISEKDHSRQEIDITPNLFLNNAMFDITLAARCQRIINALDIFASSKNEIFPILEDYYFGETSFYLVRNTGVRNNLEQEVVKFINVCLKNN